MKRLKYHLALIIILLGVLSFNLPLQGEKAANSSQKLSITEIMKGEEFVGTSPSFIMWSVDSQYVYFRWKNPEEKEISLYRLSPVKLKPEKIKIEDMLAHPPYPSQVISSFGYYRFRLGGRSLVYDQNRSL